jgi:hypothetical protein
MQKQLIIPNNPQPMKTSFLFSLPLVCCMATTVNTFAQNSDFEAWRKQKEEKYDAWKKMRVEIVSHLPTNPAMDAVGSFIDQGFDGSATVNASAPVSATSADNHAVTQPQLAIPNIKIWVVIVGVAAYDHVQSLTYTKDDAYRMYAFYKSPEGGSLPDRQIALLIDEDATRSNIVKSIHNIYSQAGKEDIIIFYFSGHGAKGAFITREFDGEDLENRKGLLLHEELQSVFRQSPAKYKYLIADACHAGSITEDATRATDTRARGAFYQAFEESTGGFVLLLSCMGDEVSLETRGVRQGVFSHYLLRGLKGESDANHDRIVSVIELFDYVDDNVKRFTQGKQNPVIDGNYSEELPISIVVN